MIWPQKRAQQTSQLPTRKRTKKTTTFRLKEHNFPDHFCTRKKKQRNNSIYIPQLHQQKKHKKCTTSLIIWPQKRAQQTSQLPMQKEHKKCTTSLMIWPQKRAQQTAQRTTRKRTKKTTTFRLKKHNFPAQKFTTAAPAKPQVLLNLQSIRACQPQPEPGSCVGPCHPLVWPALAPVSVASSGTR